MITRIKSRRPRNGKKKINTRVDFTPMVDMMMLLLTFFMFCTTLSRPQVMDIAMPVPNDDMNKISDPNTTDSQAITFILSEKNKVYYYEGMPDFEDYTSLKEIDYAQLRNVIVQKNKRIVQQINELNRKKKAKQISDEEYGSVMKAIKKDKLGTVAVIKPTKEAIYQNLVDVLDEMAICSVGRYAILDIVDADEFLVKNYETKGLYAQENVTN